MGKTGEREEDRKREAAREENLLGACDDIFGCKARVFSNNQFRLIQV
jgi:hypothetical protein